MKNNRNWAYSRKSVLFDFALDEVGTIRAGLHEELRPGKAVAFNSRRRRLYHINGDNLDLAQL